MTRRITIAFLVTALLAALMPLTELGTRDAFAASSSPSGFNVDGASDYKTCGSNCSTPSSPPTCGQFNPDNTAAELIGNTDYKSVSLWYNPTKRVSSSSLTLNLTLSGSLSTGSLSPDEWANRVGGWDTKPWSKRFTTLPDNLNGGNWRETTAANGARMKTIDVAQLVGVAAYAAHYYYKCEEYYYVPDTYPCPTEDVIDPATGKVVVEGDPDKRCPYQRKVHVRWVDRLWEVNTNGIRYSAVKDTMSWAGFGSGLCVREFYGELSGPYNPDFTRRDNFLEDIQYDRGFTGGMPKDYDPNADLDIQVSQLKDPAVLPARDGWVSTPYGSQPGSGRIGWRWCVGLKQTLGEWETPITDRGRYVGRVQFKTDWVTVAEVPRTPYKQKWDWLNDYISPSQANRRWQAYSGQQSSNGYPWGQFLLLQVGRDEPTLPNGGIFITSKDEGLFYQKSCMNGLPPGQASDSDARKRPQFGEAGYKATPLTYIAPDPNAPLDPTRAAWTDRGDPAFYWQNECPGPTMNNLNLPEVIPAGWVPDTPDLALTCVDTKQQPGCSVFDRATGQTGTTITATNGVVEVRADGSTTRVNWAPQAAPYIRTDGGTVKRDSVLWQFRVDVPTEDAGLNSPSLTSTTDMNDRNQPYGPVPWADIDAQNANPTATWWDLNRWHDIPKVERDESFTVYPAKEYTSVFQPYTYRTETYQTGTETYQTGTETYVARYETYQTGGGNWVVSAGHATYYWWVNGGRGGWACPGGWWLSGTTCYTNTYIPPTYGTRPVYASRPTYGTRPTYATRQVRNPAPAGYFDNGTQWQRDILNSPPSPTCTSYGDLWKCYTENIHDAASLTGVGMRFYENAVTGRYFQMTAAWNREATINTRVSAASSFGALMGSTMDGDIGWAELPSWSASGTYVTKDVDITMMCVARPIGLEAERVAGAITERP